MWQCKWTKDIGRHFLASPRGRSGVLLFYPALSQCTTTAMWGRLAGVPSGSGRWAIGPLPPPSLKPRRNHRVHPRRPPPPPRRSADRARSRPTSRAGEYSQGVRSLVGTGRFELPTCRLGGGRSIHLSYVPTHKDCTVLLSLLSSLRLSLRSLCLCVEFTSPQPPTPDIPPVMHPLKLDVLHSFIGRGEDRRRVRPGSRDTQHAPSGSLQPPVQRARPRVKHRRPFGFRHLHPADFLARLVRPWVPGRRHHHANARPRAPRQFLPRKCALA